MLKTFTLGIAASVLAYSVPLAAQDISTSSQEAAPDSAAGKLEEIGAMMGSLFQSDPLTEEQEARLPLATQVVGVMMPDGFYAQMMGEMMDRTLRPMMSMFSTPDLVLATRLSVNEGVLEGLDDGQKTEIMDLLDPAWDQRTDAIIDVFMGNMGGVFTTLEPPMRKGLSKAYAVRFDEQQLGDIAEFFQTPSGSVYARESMALFADPQVMSASMKAMPQLMGSFVNMEGALAEAMAPLPAERGYDDLSAAERARLAQLLGMDPVDLETAVIPPKGSDSITF